MGTTMQFALGVATGAGLLALGMLLAPVREAAPAVGFGPARDSGVGSPTATVPADDLVGSVHQLAETVSVLQRKVDQQGERLAERVLDRGGSAGPIDEAALTRAVLAALEQQARQHYEGMSFDELLAEAAEAEQKPRDRADARRALDVLLARQLSSEQRACALQRLAVVQRASHDLDASTRTLQQIVDGYGADSPDGVEASYQLAWNFDERQDYARALDCANSVLRSQCATPMLRMHARWAAAIMTNRAGNVAEAHAAFESILRDCGNDPGLRSIVTDIRNRLPTK